MKRSNCIFCNNELNNSSEHIIPDSLNGRLTSKFIICGNCNRLFGEQMDSKIKVQLNPLLFSLGLKNASLFHVTGPDNKEYLLTRDSSLKLIKPEVHYGENGGQRIFKISGTKKEIENVLKKMNKILHNDLKKTQYKFIKGPEHLSIGYVPASYAQHNLHDTEKLSWLFNKIALEFFARNIQDLTEVESLLEKVHTLSDKLNNVVFCNSQNEVRDFEATEIPHLIIIVGDSSEKRLRAYIELFGAYCGIVSLSDNYTGDDFQISYYQDALTGEKLNKTPILKFPITSDLDQQKLFSDLGDLFNDLSERKRNRLVQETVDLNLPLLLNEVKEEVKKGLVKEENSARVFVERAGYLYAHLAFQIPYSVEIDDGQLPSDNDKYNFYHSNFKPDLVDKFISNNKNLLSINLDIYGERFQFDSFYKEPYHVSKSISLVKLFIILKSQVTNQTMYIPIKQIFDILQVTEPIPVDPQIG